MTSSVCPLVLTFSFFSPLPFLIHACFLNPPFLVLFLHFLLHVFIIGCYHEPIGAPFGVHRDPAPPPMRSRDDGIGFASQNTTD